MHHTSQTLLSLCLFCARPLLTSALVLLLSSSVGMADDETAGPLQIEVLRLQLHSRTRQALRRFADRLELYLRVTNSSDEELSLSLDQIVLNYGESQAVPGRRRSKALLGSPRGLSSGKSVEGWVTFSVSTNSPQEIPLSLEWSVANQTQTTKISTELRRLLKLEVKRIGYERRIAVIMVGRTIDLPAVWVLDRKMRSLSKQGFDRVVLSVRNREEQAVASDVQNWLKLANRGTELSEQRLPVGYPAPVQFAEFHVAGIEYRRHGVLHKTETLAVAAAARTLYARLPTEVAIAAMDDEYPGIRQAALASSIDRLPDDRLRQVLSAVDEASPRDQQQLFGLLDRVSSPLVVPTLRDRLLEWLDADPRGSGTLPQETADAMARCLVRSINPGTDVALRMVWREAEKKPEIRTAIVEEVMETHEDRWLPLVADFAIEELQRYVASSDGKETSRRRRVTQTSRLLPRSLEYLRQYDEDFLDAARRFLLLVKSAGAQDELLRMVNRSSRVEDRQLVTECITERLESASLTPALNNIIRGNPDPRWTQRLFELHQSKNPQSRRIPTLVAALHCANDEQLNVIIDQFDSLTRQRPYLLSHLAQRGHPRTAEVFKKSLDGPAGETSQAVRSVGEHLTPEVLQVMLDRLESIRMTAAEDGRLDVGTYQLARQLMSPIAQCDHPEARRVLNLASVSPVKDFRQEAISHADESYRSEAASRQSEVWLLQRQKRYDEALRLVNELIALDPLYPGTRLTRGLLYLRDGKLSLALEDIERANALNPADPITESTIALTRVRIGDVETGIQEAEAVLARVPAAAEGNYRWTLYNTACVYGRAVEQDGLSEEARKNYYARGMQLFQQSVEAGINDRDHVANDPDLVVFHDDPAWGGLLSKIPELKADEEEQ